LWALLLAALGIALTGLADEGPGDAAAARVLKVAGPIGPATVGFVTTELERAEASSAPIVVLILDTPGGLDSSKRDIIRSILGSTVPIATYATPAGARAASAGTYILYASHIAAMAPATNLGAATPVQIGGLPGAPEPGDGSPIEEPKKAPVPKPREPAAGPESSPGKSPMERKLVNDARAYIRSLAQMRGRNAEWAERAVSEAASLSASEALELGVIDAVADSITDLFAQIDGRPVQTGAVERVLATFLGRFRAVKGPGLIIVIPGLQQMVRVDLRTVVMDVPSQDVISRDNVSVKVNAVLYFRVIDPQRAIIQVEDY
jgi:membrane-bound serine protease (ClpP class)